MTSETLERIAADALEAEVLSCRRPHEGSVADTAVLVVASDRENVPERVVCKLGGASVWTGDVIEPRVIECVGDATAIPVPGVLATGSLAGDSSTLQRFACYEYLEGTTPVPYRDLEPAVRRRQVADAGALLGELHAASAMAVDRVGGLARDASAETGLSLRDPDGWHAMDPGPVGSALVTLLETTMLEDTTLEGEHSRAPWLSHSVPLAGDSDCRPVLTHGDYQPSNLLAADGTVTAVLDWGNAHVTHAGYALARAEARFVDVHRRWCPRSERRRLRRTFRDAYATRAALPDAFDARAPAYKLCWLAQSGANYGRLVRSARGRTQLWRQWCRLLESTDVVGGFIPAIHQ